MDAWLWRGPDLEPWIVGAALRRLFAWSAGNAEERLHRSLGEELWDGSEGFRVVVHVYSIQVCVRHSASHWPKLVLATECW
jgi:hypothetical protein